MRWLKGRRPDEFVTRSDVQSQFRLEEREGEPWEIFLMELVDDHIGPLRAADLYQFVRHMVKGEGAYVGESVQTSLWTKKYNWDQIRMLGESEK